MFFSKKGVRAALCAITSLLGFISPVAGFADGAAFKPSIEFVSATVTSPSSVNIAWNVLDTGAGVERVSVGVVYGNQLDLLSDTQVLSHSAPLGSGSAQLGGLEFGRTYYAQLIVSADGISGTPSEIFSFSFDMPPSAPDWYGRKIKSIEDDGVHLKLTFQRAGRTLPLYLAYGRNCGGETTNSWEFCEKVADVKGDDADLAVSLPAGWGESVKYLRAFFMLPEELAAKGTRLDYISGGNKRYINTGLYPNKNLRTEFTFSTTDTANDKMTFGARDTKDASKNFQYLVWLSKDPGTKINVCWGSKANLQTVSTGKQAGEIWTLNYGQHGVYVDDTLMIPESTLKPRTTDITSAYPLILMGLFTNGTIDSRTFYGKCYGFKAFWESESGDGETLAMDMIPFRQNDVAGMLDLVSGNFYPSNGSSAFTAGNDVSALSVSDIVMYRDYSKPILDEAVYVDNLIRGDRVSISGSLLGTGAGDVEISVEVSRSGDFEDAVVWPVESVFNEAGGFAVELYDSDPTSERYIIPGEKTFFRIWAVDKSGAVAVSDVLEFATLSAAGMSDITLTNNGRLITLGATLSPVGANTNYVQAVWSVDDASLCNTSQWAVVDAESGVSNISIDVVVPKLGAFNYAFLCSNDCSTAVWVSQTAVLREDLKDTSTYLWRKTVAKGDWEDDANWDGGEYGSGHPHADSIATFDEGIEAEVTISSPLVKVKRINLKTANLKVTFTGGTGNTLETEKCDPSGTGGEICVSNLNFTLTQGGMVIGKDRLFSLRDNATNRIVNAAYGIDANKQTGSKVLVQGGSQLYMLGNLQIGGTGAGLEIDDGHVFRPCARDKGIRLGKDYVGGDIIFRGRRAKLELNGELRHATTTTSKGRLIFVIPEGGFDGPVINQIPQEGTSTYTTTSLGNQNYANFVFNPITIVIDPDSPGLKCGAESKLNKLIAWKAGITTGRFAIEFENGLANRMLYSVKFTGQDDWSESWPEKGFAYSIALQHERQGSMILVY